MFCEARTYIKTLKIRFQYEIFLKFVDHSLSGLFILRKGGTTMYRPQYLEQKHEVITVQNGNGEIVRKYRRPIKSDTYKRKESNEVIPLYGKRIAKY